MERVVELVKLAGGGPTNFHVLKLSGSNPTNPTNPTNLHSKPNNMMKTQTTELKQLKGGMSKNGRIRMERVYKHP